jgi:hypothetical protein
VAASISTVTASRQLCFCVLGKSGTTVSIIRAKVLVVWIGRARFLFGRSRLPKWRACACSGLIRSGPYVGSPHWHVQVLGLCPLITVEAAK